jgi:hypothetical protein
MGAFCNSRGMIYFIYYYFYFYFVRTICLFSKLIPQRHEALRTTFHLHKGHLMQITHKSMPILFELTDLSAYDHNLQGTIINIAKKSVALKFDLAKGPLMSTVSFLPIPSPPSLHPLSVYRIFDNDSLFVCYPTTNSSCM